MFKLPNVDLFVANVKRGQQRQQRQQRNNNNTYQDLGMKYYKENNSKKEKKLLPLLKDKINNHLKEQQEYKTLLQPKYDVLKLPNIKSLKI